MVEERFGLGFIGQIERFIGTVCGVEMVFPFLILPITPFSIFFRNFEAMVDADQVNGITSHNRGDLQQHVRNGPAQIHDMGCERKHVRGIQVRLFLRGIDEIMRIREVSAMIGVDWTSIFEMQHAKILERKEFYGGSCWMVPLSSWKNRWNLPMNRAEREAIQIKKLLRSLRRGSN